MLCKECQNDSVLSSLCMLYVIMHMHYIISNNKTMYSASESSILPSLVLRPELLGSLTDAEKHMRLLFLGTALFMLLLDMPNKQARTESLSR